VTGYDERGAVHAPHLTLPSRAVADLHAGAAEFCRIADETGLGAAPVRPWLEAFLHAPDQTIARAVGAARFNSGITVGSALVRRTGDLRGILDLSRAGPFSEWPGGWLAGVLPWMPGALRRMLSKGLTASVSWRRQFVRAARRWLRRS
jgi:hypothetical protein